MKTSTKRASGKSLKTAATTGNDYAQRIERAIELQAQIKAMSDEVNSIKEYFLSEIEQNKCSTLYVTDKGAVELKTTNSYSCDPSAIPDLKKIFKENYSAFVTEKTTYGVSASLKKLLSDADYKHKDIVRNAVVIKTSSSVAFVAAKS